MSRPRSPHRPSAPQAALDALLSEPAGDPVRRALWLDGLDHQLRPLLPPALAAHSRLANFERGRLVFVVDAPVWRAKLRLAAPELLNAARSLGLEASDLVVKTATVSGSEASAPPRAIAPRPMSAASLEDLRAALASLKDRDGADSSETD